MRHNSLIYILAKIEINFIFSKGACNFYREFLHVNRILHIIWKLIMLFHMSIFIPFSMVTHHSVLHDLMDVSCFIAGLPASSPRHEIVGCWSHHFSNQGCSLPQIWSSTPSTTGRCRPIMNHLMPVCNVYSINVMEKCCWDPSQCSVSIRTSFRTNYHYWLELHTIDDALSLP